MIKEIFRNIISKVLTGIKFSSSRRKSVNTLDKPQWEVNNDCHTCLIIRYHNKYYDYENNDKYSQLQKYSRKVREESVEAIQTISFSQKTSCTIHWPFLPSQ